MRHCLFLVLVALVACSSNTDDPPVDVDAGPPGTEVDANVPVNPGLDIVHVPKEAESIGTGDLIFDVDTTIVTGPDAPVIEGVTLPDGVELATVAQEPSGDELAILRVKDLAINAGITVRVKGTRPFVILSNQVNISGVLDGSGHQSEPGPGGALPVEGEGVGKDGVNTGSLEDGGGGGAGYGASGGRGGNAECGGNGCTIAGGGAPGTSYGDETITVLRGGSGGGYPSETCREEQPPPGAGGGAIQIYAETQINIASGDLGINVGGGGGGRGANCGQWGAGGGGGSGGSLVLQAPRVFNFGILASNGGGGGGGAGDPDSDGDNGRNGGDGTDGLLAVTAAPGGPGQPFWGAAGGAGGYGEGPAQNGATEIRPDGNGGGGGGSVGRISILTGSGSVDGTGRASPAATVRGYQIE